MANARPSAAHTSTPNNIAEHGNRSARDSTTESALLRLTEHLYQAGNITDVYSAGLDGVIDALGCQRASILLFDSHAVVRFVAWRNLSDGYRAAVDGHSPWQPETKDAAPIAMDDVASADLPAPLKHVIEAEGIGALAFIPLAAGGRLIGKFMAYYDRRHHFSPFEMNIALAIGRQLALSIERARAEEQLRHERELLQTIIDRIPVMVALYEPDRRVLRLNPEFESVTGWSSDDARGISLMEACYPDPSYRKKIARFMETCPEGWMDIRMRTRGGTDVETSWANVKLSDGRQIGIGLDISKRKRAEAQRSLLMHELNHRVKNTLATVQSLASQTLRNAGDDPDALSRFEARLVTLARAHDLLTKENWEGADLLSVAERSIEPFNGASRIVLSGPPARLKPKQALAFAMALHELATNAVKYGALSDEKGFVDVRWSFTADELVLTWRERDGPVVASPQRHGFGSRLIARLEHDLGAKAEIEFPSDGVTAIIRTHASGALRNGAHDA